MSDASELSTAKSPFAIKSKAVLSRLLKLGSLPAWILALNPLWKRLYNVIDASSNAEWVYSALRSKFMAELWAGIVSPTGTFLAMAAGLAWLAFIALREKKQEPSEDHKSVNQDSVQSAEKQIADTSPGGWQLKGTGTVTTPCSYEWVHKKADDDRASIKNMVRIVGIFYRPDFDKSHIDFIFGVFNNSLYDVLIDNSVGSGFILYGPDHDKFHYSAKFLSEKPIYCGSRDKASFVVRQPIRDEGTERRLAEKGDILISFGNLPISFQGTPQFPEIGITPLDTNHHLETKKGIWSGDEPEIVFGYTDEQWAKVTQGGPEAHEKILELTEEREFLKSELEARDRLILEIDLDKSHIAILPERGNPERNIWAKLRVRFSNTNTMTNRITRLAIDVLRPKEGEEETVPCNSSSYSVQADQGPGGGVRLEDMIVAGSDITRYYWIMLNFTTRLEDVEGAFIRVTLYALRQPPQKLDFQLNWQKAEDNTYSELTPLG
jgi:hypothetical protein